MIDMYELLIECKRINTFQQLDEFTHKVCQLDMKASARDQLIRRATRWWVKNTYHGDS